LCEGIDEGQDLGFAVGEGVLFFEADVAGEEVDLELVVAQGNFDVLYSFEVCVEVADLE
jgi:hypothetical protein